MQVTPTCFSQRCAPHGSVRLIICASLTPSETKLGAKREAGQSWLTLAEKYLMKSHAYPSGTCMVAGTCTRVSPKGDVQHIYKSQDWVKKK
jgi:hypothetical protein